MRFSVRTIILAICAVGVTVLAVGCGSNGAASTTSSASHTSTETGGKFAALNAKLDAEEKQPSHLAITTPITGSIPKKKVVAYLSCGVPACSVRYAPLQAAAAAVGWTTKFINIGLTPESVQAGWAEAVRQKPDAVVATGGYPAQEFKSSLAIFEQRKTPIMGYAYPQTGKPPGFIGSVLGGVVYTDIVGPEWARWVAGRSDGKANVLFVWSSTYPVFQEQVNGYKSEIAKLCSMCQTEFYNAPIADVGQNLGSEIATKVQANPKINYIVLSLDDMALGLPQALAGVGKTAGKDVQIITQDQDPQIIGMIRSGQLQGTLTTGGELSIWQSFDGILRALTGGDPSVSTGFNSYTPWWITKKSLLPAGSVYDPANYQQQFEALWRVHG